MRSVILIFIGFLVFSCSYFQSESDRLQDFIQKVNKKCPAMLDSETRLDSLNLTGDLSLRYNYTLVNAQVAQVDTAEFRRAVFPELLSMVKLSPEMQKLRENSMTIEYLYADAKGERIILLRIGPQEYQKTLSE